LRISQSAILRSIANVEHELGATLLEQTPRGVEPTALGRALIRYTRCAAEAARRTVQPKPDQPGRSVSGHPAAVAK
jgi:DNA-binding transcriptional LysR family regulator